MIFWQFVLHLYLNTEFVLLRMNFESFVCTFSWIKKQVQPNAINHEFAEVENWNILIELMSVLVFSSVAIHK